jgi:predicted transcriptional regulator
MTLLSDDSMLARKGAKPSYGTIEVIRVLLKIKRVGLVSRAQLSEELGIGEGAVRSLVRKLSLMGLVEVIRSGCTLTTTGEQVVSAFSEHVRGPVELDLTDVWNHARSVGLSVKEGARIVGRGLEERDEAVRHGAEAAMVLIYRSGRVLMPELEDVTSQYPHFSEKITSSIKPGEDDCIIIAGASSYRRAESGALGAALSLLRKLWSPKITQ